MRGVGSGSRSAKEYLGLSEGIIESLLREWGRGGYRREVGGVGGVAGILIVMALGLHEFIKILSQMKT